MGERRGSRRSKSFLRGLVHISRKRGGLACLVRDLSDKGARIIFSDIVMLPDVVDLNIPQRDLTLRARVQWRRNHEIGLAFLEIPRVSGTTEMVQRIAMLEAEIASLRAHLKRLKGEKSRAANEEAA